MKSRISFGKKLMLIGFIPEEIKHILLRSALRIPDLPEGYTFELARTKDDLNAAFSILYDAYYDAGITKSDPSGKRITKYHILPSTLILTAKYFGEVIGTVSIICDSSFGLPSDSIADFSALRESGKRIAEISSLAVKKDFQKRSSTIHLYLSKYMFLCWFRYIRCNWAVLSVHPSRMDIYKALFRFRSFGKRKICNHSFANNAPAAVGFLNVDQLNTILKKAYRGKPFNRNLHKFLYAPLNFKERNSMKFLDSKSFGEVKSLSDMTLLDYCFNSGNNLLDNFSKKEVEYLKDIYSNPDTKGFFSGSESKREMGKVEPV